MTASKSDLSTYIDSAVGVDLVPAPRAKLLFKAWLDHGPGHSEEMFFSVGPSKCELYDVLWIKSDWADMVSALAWLPKGQLKGSTLFRVPLAGYWRAEKKENEWEEPNYSEIDTDKKSALSAKEVNDLVKQIWPE